MFDCKVNAAEFEANLAKWIRAKKLSLREGIRRQAGLYASELMAETPPSRGLVGDEMMNAKRAGEARVARDVNRAVKSMKPEDWRSPFLRIVAEMRDYGALQAAMKDSSAADVVHFTPGLHRHARDRFGRVKRAQNRMTPDWREHYEYTKGMQRHVGIAKAGWAASAIALGRKAPKWLSPHLWAGSLIDRLGDREPSVVMRNRSAWADSPMAQMLVGKVIERRRGRMARDLAGMMAKGIR